MHMKKYGQHTVRCQSILAVGNLPIKHKSLKQEFALYIQNLVYAFNYGLMIFSRMLYMIVKQLK